MSIGRKNLLILLLLTTQLALAIPRYILVKAGNAESLIDAINQANTVNADTTAQRLYILIPDGVYDLGEQVLTCIWGHNIALVGQSMEGTIIMNAPKVENEGIGTTGTFLNRGYYTYVQDLTIKNNLDYYHSGPAGRAVCWQDKGFRAMFKRVRMLSYQDTYYSHSEECQHYFEDTEIHGTVDFICGAGDVFFNHCLIVTEKRNEDGSGRNVIAAPRTSTTQWGYIFNECTIRNDMSTFHFARGWHTQPRCTWINTKLETPEKLEATRFDPYSIRSVDCYFGEYGTTDNAGNNITPQQNTITLIVNNDSNTVQTTLTRDQARRFSIRNVFPDWKPDRQTKQLEREATMLRRRLLNS